MTGPTAALVRFKKAGKVPIHIHAFGLLSISLVPGFGARAIREQHRHRRGH